MITLTTDFGLDDGYVAQMKGVIHEIAPHAKVIDLTHSVPPQDMEWAAWLLHDSIEAFPDDAIHVVVVDPGVGTARDIVAIESGGQRFVGPNNGLFGFLAEWEQDFRAVKVKQPKFWRDAVTATFHGRDIMAPVAAHWLQGVALAEFGPESGLHEIVDFDRRLMENEKRIEGRVVRIDRFGNLVSSIHPDTIPQEVLPNVQVICGDVIANGVHTCYADAARGEILCLVGSCGRLELAINCGNAAEAAGVTSHHPAFIVQW